MQPYRSLLGSRAATTPFGPRCGRGVPQAPALDFTGRWGWGRCSSCHPGPLTASRALHTGGQITPFQTYNDRIREATKRAGESARDHLCGKSRLSQDSGTTFLPYLMVCFPICPPLNFLLSRLSLAIYRDLNVTFLLPSPQPGSL